MPFLLFFLFIVVPILELAVIVEVAGGIGLGNTLALLILVSLAGAWLVKREGIGAWRRVQEQVQAGRVPAKEMVDGVMILVGGALLLTPGFLTDAVGLSLLLPPVRAVLRRLMRRRITGWVTVSSGASTRTHRVDIGDAWLHERERDRERGEPEEHQGRAEPRRQPPPHPDIIDVDERSPDD